MRSEWSRVAQIYTRILQVPLQQLDRYHARLLHYDCHVASALRMFFG